MNLSPCELETAGEVFLIGAGPGSPDLLTVRAARLLAEVDVVLYDKLVSREIMALVSESAEKIYVGKIKGYHSLPQERLNELLVDLALQGKKVCRLKGGDPFMFGRGGEELETLAKHNIKFEVVPGITAAAGCAAYSGIPLTHREHTQMCTFVTGHQKQNGLTHDWAALAAQQQTLVFYMGLTNISEISAELIKHGLAQTTPVAIIENGTTKNQRVVETTLAGAEVDVEEYKISSPALVVIGSVVSLRHSLNWFYSDKEITKTPLAPTDTVAA